MKAKLDPWQKLRRAMMNRTGIRLTAEEVQRLSVDEAIWTAALNAPDPGAEATDDQALTPSAKRQVPAPVRYYAKAVRALAPDPGAGSEE